MLLMEPQNIAAGWMKRWSSQTVDLYKRAPWFPVAVIGLQIWFYHAIWTLPHPFLGLSLVFGGMLFILSYVFLRAIDENSGTVFSTALGYLSAAKWDILKFTQWLLIIAVAFICLNQIIFSALNTIPQTKGHLFPEAFHTHALDVLGTQFELNFLMIAVDVSIFLPYLTLMNGFHIRDNYILSGIAIRKNRIHLSALVLTFGGINIACAGLGTLSVYLHWFYWVDKVLLSAIFLLFVTFGYLASREVFEGRKDNQKQTEKSKVSTLVGAH